MLLCPDYVIISNLLFVGGIVIVNVFSMSITMVSIHIGANPLYGYYVAMPVYRVAMEHIQKLYPNSLGNLSHVEIYLPGFDLCQAGGDRAANFFAHFYYTNLTRYLSNQSFVAMFSPECTEQVLQLADLAREFDMPLFTSVAGDSKLTSRRRYPTTSALAPLARSDSMAGINAFLMRFSWRRIALMCDMLTQFPGLNFYSGQCGDIRQLFTSLGYRWYYQPFDTGKSKPFRENLLALKGDTRIFLILTTPEFVRELMIEADKLGMTSGEYVFICLQPTKRPGVRTVTWLSPNDTSDNNARALNAYNTLILLTGIGPEWNLIKNLTEEFLQTSIGLHNHTYPAEDKENELQICIYESAMMFGQIFNEYYPSVISMPRKTFLTKFFNRTFDFAGRNISTDAVGSKINHVVILRLSNVSRLMETAMLYNTETKSFYGIRDELWYWVNRTNAPPDTPRCRECSTAGTTPIETIIACSLLGIVLVVTGILLRKYHNNERNSSWWLMEITLKSNNEMTPTAFDEVVKKVTGFKCRDARDNDICLYAYEMKPTNVIGAALTEDDIKRNHKLINIMREVHNLNHPNVAVFRGLTLASERVFLLSEYASRQTLRFFLDQEGVLSSDKEFQFSLCWDLIEGVLYLHNFYGAHGNINSFTCLVDFKFHLKISQTGYGGIADCLLAEQAEEETKALQRLQSIWWPSDVLEGGKNFSVIKKRLLSKEADIYAVGVVFYEIFTGTLLSEAYAALYSSPDGGGFQRTTLNKFELKTDNASSIRLLSDPLKTLLAACLGHKSLRPTAKAFRSKLQAIKSKPTHLVEHIIHKLESHAENLEVVVGDRTTQLQDEMRVADELLQEMLPREVIRKMRNGETVVPELFQSVTLMFSDIPVFQDVLRLSAIEVIAFLNETYSLFDEIIPSFDAYKVETVADSYIVVSGLPNRNGLHHAYHICSLALTVLKAIEEVENPMNKMSTVLLRVGVNTGPVVGGVTGSRMPRYCLFGDTMNTASRMESNGQGGKIHMSANTRDLVAEYDQFKIVPRGRIVVKGKGEMETFWLEGR